MKSIRFFCSSVTFGLNAKSIGFSLVSGERVSIGARAWHVPRAWTPSEDRGKESARLVGARVVFRAALVLRRLNHRKMRADPLHRFRIRVQSVLNDLDRACHFERRLFNKHPRNHRVSFYRYRATLRRAAAPSLPPSPPFLRTSVESC